MERESIKVLKECIDLQDRKSKDYQNPDSNIVQSMHYRRGVSTIHDMIHQKMLRAQSLLEPIEKGQDYNPNFESLEDTYKDLINYASFAVAYIRGKMEGQSQNRDLINRSKEPLELSEDMEVGSTFAIKGTYKTVNIHAWRDPDNWTLNRSSPVAGYDDDDVRITMDSTEVPEATHKDPNDSLRRFKETYKTKVAPKGAIVPPEDEDDKTLRFLTTESDKNIIETYASKVRPKGFVKVPDGEVRCTDGLVKAYSENVKDYQNREDEDFDELHENIKNEVKHEDSNRDT